MKKLLVISTLALTLILYGIGYAVSFAITVLAMTFDLPGPYSDDPIVWLWFGLSLLSLLAVAFLFCRWLINRARQEARKEATFE